MPLAPESMIAVLLRIANWLEVGVRVGLLPSRVSEVKLDTKPTIDGLGLDLHSSAMLAVPHHQSFQSLLAMLLLMVCLCGGVFVVITFFGTCGAGVLHTIPLGPAVVAFDSLGGTVFRGASGGVMFDRGTTTTAIASFIASQSKSFGHRGF